MNGNFPFQLVSNVFDPLQIAQPVGFGVLPSQSIQYVPTATYTSLPDVNSGMGMCLPAQQPILGGSSTYTLVNQNGVTYLAVTPNFQPLATSVPCFPTEVPLQGVQAVQVINNATSSTSFIVQNSPYMNPTPQCILPMQSTIAPMSTCPQFVTQCKLQTPSADLSAVQLLQPSVVNFSIKSEPIDQESQENLNSQNFNEFGAKCLTSALQNDHLNPVNVLTSLETALASPQLNNLPVASNTVIHGGQSYIHGDNVCIVGEQEISPETIGQVPNNAQTFHVLIPTSQGMTIQTVVTNCPNQEAILPSLQNPAAVINLEQESSVSLQNPVNPCTPQPILNNQLSTVVNVSDVKTSVSSENTLLQANIVTSHNPSSTEIATKNEQLKENEEETVTVSQDTLSISSPDSSYCLPDSTDDLCQPTIKQSSSSIVDGIDLEEIREFARTFKMRRLFLGLTQTQVGQALCATEGPAYSQSAICRFEKLDITPRSAMKIRPVLEKWLREAEAKYQQGQISPAGADFVNLSSAGKIRKRRTFFSAEALAILNSRFDRNSHPSGREINSIAQDIGYDRDVVRVWFCNKRQSLRQSSCSQRGRINQKSS